VLERDVIFPEMSFSSSTFGNDTKPSELFQSIDNDKKSGRLPFARRINAR
jgi:hypothetical protein